MSFADNPGYFDRGVSAIPTPEPGPSYVNGLDLGQAHDPSALAIIELPSNALRHLGRWPLGTAYTKVADDCLELMQSPSLQGRGTLVVDATGAGRPVIEMLRGRGLAPIPVVITAGWAVTSEDGWWHVPKRDLVAALAMGFEAGGVRVADGLEYASVLRREISNFRAKITAAGNDTYAAWRESEHDDLVLAVALAVWWARKTGHFSNRDHMLVPKGKGWKETRP